MNKIIFPIHCKPQHTSKIHWLVLQFLLELFGQTIYVCVLKQATTVYCLLAMPFVGHLQGAVNTTCNCGKLAVAIVTTMT